jgi:hypothetical protein
MSVQQDLMTDRTTFEDIYGKYPQVMELWELWPSILDKPAFARYVNNLPVFKAGFEPIPNFRRYESLLRQAGHGLASQEALPKTNLLRSFFRPRATREHYYVLSGTVMNLMLTSPSAFTADQISVLFSTLDRLLRGVRDWKTVTRVPAASRQFYESLAQVRLPTIKTTIGLQLASSLRPAAKQRFGPGGGEAIGLFGPLSNFLAAAEALRHGRSVGTVNDSVEAIHAALSLFDTDLYGLPLVIREGRSGYEKAG